MLHAITDENRQPCRKLITRKKNHTLLLTDSSNTELSISCMGKKISYWFIQKSKLQLGYSEDILFTHEDIFTHGRLFIMPNAYVWIEATIL